MSCYSREYITEQIAAFEKIHDVASYEINGTLVWPIIRISIAAGLHAGIFSTASIHKPIPNSCSPPLLSQHLKHIYLNNKRRSKRFVKKIVMYLADQRKKKLPEFPEVDVVIVTAVNRNIVLGRKQYNTVVEPLIEALESQCIRSLVWENGGNAERLKGFPSWHDENQKIRYSLIPEKYSVGIIKPDWFTEISSWLLDVFKIDLPWSFLERNLRRLFYFSSIVKSWLEKTGCKLLITDCWYNQNCLAFIHAASELNINTLDFQHGLQGAGHFAYQEWNKVPSNGYSLVPKTFWVWGKDDAKNMIEGGIQRVGEKDVIVGGNLWLNKWRQNDENFIQFHYQEAIAISSMFTNVIIVTLQKDIDNLNIIKKTIDQSSRKWLWMIRVHRHDIFNLNEIEKYFEGLAHPGVNVRKATELPLYTLFQIADVHITGYSTCALEALPFGVPTILIHDSGKIVYKKFIKDGTMIFAGSPSEIHINIRKLAEDRFGQIDFSSEDIFSFHENLEPIINNLVEGV